MKWFLLKTKPNSHFIASENLKRQGYDVFLPLVLKTKKVSGRFVNKVIPLFEGYVFMGVSNRKISWQAINSTRGISKAITLDGRYYAVDCEIIESLKRRCNSSGIIQKMEEVATGDRVRVEKGPFANFICQVEEISDNDRVWVLLEILQQKIRANLLINDLSKVS